MALRADLDANLLSFHWSAPELELGASDPLCPPGDCADLLSGSLVIENVNGRKTMAPSTRWSLATGPVPFSNHWSREGVLRCRCQVVVATTGCRSSVSTVSGTDQSTGVVTAAIEGRLDGAEASVLQSFDQ
jgi:hypothetical protein